MFKPANSDAFHRRRTSYGSESSQVLKRFWSNSSFQSQSGLSQETQPPEAEALRVMILVNGGAVSFESVAAALDHQCPVVICRGSGRAADFLAALKDYFKDNCRSPPFAVYEKAWKIHMNAGADEKNWKERWSKDDVKGLRLIRKIIENESVVVFVKT